MLELSRRALLRTTACGFGGLALQGLLAHRSLADSRLPAGAPHDRFEQVELGELIERSFAVLPPEQRLVLTLCDVHGFAYDETADLAGLPMGTVKSRINRARARVRDYLLQYPELLPPAFRPRDGAGRLASWAGDGEAQLEP